MMKDRSHGEAMEELFHAEPSYMAKLLGEVIHDGNADELAILEQHMSGAFAMREVNPAS